MALSSSSVLKTDGLRVFYLVPRMLSNDTNIYLAHQGQSVSVSSACRAGDACMTPLLIRTYIRCCLGLTVTDATSNNDDDFEVLRWHFSMPVTE